MKVLVVCVALVCGLAAGLPRASDPEYKPTLADPNKPVVDPRADAYDLLSSPVSEPADKLPPTSAPQTASLISLQEETNNVTQAASVPGQDTPAVDPTPLDTQQKDQTNAVPIQEQPVVKVAEQSGVALSGPVHINPINSSYPVVKDGAVASYRESSEAIAAPPVLDPTGQDLYGVHGPPVVIDRPEDKHPMEVLTPLWDNFPCDPSRVLDVHVPAAKFRTGVSVPFLPNEFGCSAWDDISREKASPEITWTNVYDDVVDFSLQMIDLGENCEGKGPEAGRIHWHVTGIAKAPSVTLAVGASNDARMLFGGKEEPNQWLEEYYAGPCPTRGTTGCYRFKVLAHRASGNCQCGHTDVLFQRSDKPVEWVYNKPKFVDGKKDADKDAH